MVYQDRPGGRASAGLGLAQSEGDPHVSAPTVEAMLSGSCGQFPRHNPRLVAVTSLPWEPFRARPDGGGSHSPSIFLSLGCIKFSKTYLL